ncbi:MAG: hypothetical protein AABZ08_08505 [Planctomycetota bacterium]
MATEQATSNTVDRPIDRRRRSWLIALACAALAALFFTSAWQRIWGADYWWQLETGRFVAEKGIPRVDPYCYSTPSRPWVELRWLYCLLMQQVIVRFGLTTMIAVKTAVLGGAFGLILQCVRTRRVSPVVMVVLMFAILAAGRRFFLRPEIVSMAMFSAYLWLLVRHRERPSRWTWVIPALQIIWVNSHTVFILGPVVVAMAAGTDALAMMRRTHMASEEVVTRSRRLRLLIVLLLFTSLACLANPYGWDGVAFPFQLFRQIRGTAFKEYIAEFGGIYNSPHSFVSVWCFDVLLTGCIVSSLLNRRRLDGFLTLVGAVTAYLTILAVRNLPLFAMASVPLISFNVERIAEQWTLVTARVRRVLSTAALLIVIGMSSWYTWQFATDRAFLGIVSSVQFGTGFAYPEYPVEAERFVREQHLPTPLFNTMSEGSYLLAHGHKVFIDPRLEVYGETAFARYIDILQSADSFHRAAEEYGFKTLFVANHNRIINHVVRLPNWKLVYFDECVAVFVRADALGEVRPIQTTDDFARVLSGVRERLRPPAPGGSLGLFDTATNSIPFLFLSDFLRVMRQPGLALSLIEDAIAAYPETTNARQSLEDVKRILASQSGTPTPSPTENTPQRSQRGG